MDNDVGHRQPRHQAGDAERSLLDPYVEVGRWQQGDDDADIDGYIAIKWLPAKARRAALALQVAQQAEIRRMKRAVQVELPGIVVECVASIRFEVGAELLQEGAPELAPELEPELAVGSSAAPEFNQFQ